MGFQSEREMDTKDPAELNVVTGLDPTHEHFFKKYLLRNRLSHELHQLSHPDCCKQFGYPFKSSVELADEKSLHSTTEQIPTVQLPLLRYFFNTFVSTFPFIASNPKHEQLIFWQDTVQPFLENLNSKQISKSHERKGLVTKRHRANTKVLSGVLLFFNSMLVSPQELTYLNSNHLEASASSRLDKLGAGKSGGGGTKRDPNPLAQNTTNQAYMTYNSDIAINVVAVRRVTREGPDSEEGSNTGSYWKPKFRIFGTATPSLAKKRHHYEFIIEVTKRTKTGAKNQYSYNSHYIARPYHEFRQMEKRLKRQYPGLMSTDAPKLPRKLTHDGGISSSEWDTKEKSMNSTNALRASTSSQSSSSSNYSNVSLFREKLRLALRGYLNSLLKFPEIALSNTLEDFLSNPQEIFYELSEIEEKDSQERINHEKSMLETQYEFQQKASSLILGLSKDFDGFKKKLVMNKGALEEIFNEIGSSKSINDLSPMLRTFIEWCKLETAATLYQMFLSHDNAGEWFAKCKKFHGLFPYSVVYGILRFTNPVKVVTRVVDLLLVNIPNINPWGESGGKSLLSMIFVMLLNEDLNDFTKELVILEQEKIVGDQYSIFLQRLRAYLDEDESILEDIREDAAISEQDLVLTVLSTDKLEPRLSDDDWVTFADIERSFCAYETVSNKRTDLSNEDKSEALHESELYLNLKQYWQIQIRKRDKDLMKQLWQEPELTKMLKQFLTLFYQPMMKVLGKCDIHLVFKDFQIFMDDLMITLEKLSDGEMYFMSSLEIFNILKSLLDRHEIVFWRFLHTLYVKDDSRLFLGLIQWAERFLTILRLKYTNTSSVSLDLEELARHVDVDKEKFSEQLNALVNQTLEKRRLYKDYLDEKANISEKSVLPGSQRDLDRKWDETNENIFGNGESEFGINAEDLDDFNLEVAGGIESKPAGYGDIDEHEQDIDRELQRKIRALDNEQGRVGTSELDKFDNEFSIRLSDLLGSL
ncbi:hypothetical protein CAAN1_21S00430 [[Candida] anglica]|uniref:PX domain-containing protein n=1 Tax=[Candida] anglica TaxID=148631 RepID=A0ABP0EDT1_9ASCO